jgi:hypothetical protein
MAQGDTIPSIEIEHRFGEVCALGTAKRANALRLHETGTKQLFAGLALLLSIAPAASIDNAQRSVSPH